MKKLLTALIFLLILAPASAWAQWDKTAPGCPGLNPCNLNAKTAGANILNLADPNITNSGGHGSDAFATMHVGFGPSTWTSPSELLFENNLYGQNVIAVENTNPQGFSSVIIRGDDNIEHSALGCPNTGNTTFIQPGRICAWEISHYNGAVNSLPMGVVTASLGSTFTGTGSGTNLTTSSVTGVIHPGTASSATITGTGVPANTFIVSQTSGTPGGAGVYVTNNATTSSGATITNTSNVMDVTGVTSGTLAVNMTCYQAAFGALTNNTQIQAQLTGSAGSTGTYQVNITQQNASGTVSCGMTPPNWFLAQTGDIAGSNRTGVSMVELYGAPYGFAGFSAGHFSIMDGATPANHEIFATDPAQQSVRANFHMLVGNNNSAVTPTSGYVMDVYGKSCMGNQVTSRGGVCPSSSGPALTIIDTGTVSERWYQPSQHPLDFTWSGSGASLVFNIRDGDGANNILSFPLNGSGNITVPVLSASLPVCTDASKNLTSTCPAGNGSGAPQTVTYQPGLLTAVNGTIGVFKKFVKASTVDNLIGSAITFSCVANPTITLYECGTSTTCAAPTTIGTVTVTAAGTRTDGTVSNPAIAAGDSIGWAITAGTCASLDISANAEVHAN